MIHIKEIMLLLNVEKAIAFEIFKAMQIDFSECSQEEFEAEAKSVFAQIK